MIPVMKGTLAALAVIVAWFAFMYLGATWNPFAKTEPCARAAQLREYLDADRKRVASDRLLLKSKDLEVDAFLVGVSPKYARQHPQEIEQRIAAIRGTAAGDLDEDENTVQREETELMAVESACQEKSRGQGRQ